MKIRTAALLMLLSIVLPSCTAAEDSGQGDPAVEMAANTGRIY